MRLMDFEAQRDKMECRRCGSTSLESYKPNNGNHVGVRCTACGCKDPIEQGVWWLAQDGSREHLRKSKHNVAEVWQRWGNHCAFCGKSGSLCERLGISRQAQHVYPIMFGGAEDGPVIPICARCQEMTRPLLLETRSISDALAELDVKPKANGLFSDRR